MVTNIIVAVTGFYNNLNLDLKLFALFILVMAIFLIYKRKEVVIQKVAWPIVYIIMYRTKWGLKQMDAVAEKYGNWVKLFGLCSIGVGFVGMGWVCIEILKITISFIKAPVVTETGVALVVPGVTLPGLGTLSFFHWLIALTILVIVHEFSHGMVARAHGLKIKSSGFAFASIILPIFPAAFVEPDEKELVKQNHIVQNSIYAAGPISNMILTGIVILIFTYLFTPGYLAMTDQDGVSFDIINETLPAAQYGLKSGMVITSIDGEQINNTSQLTNVLSKVSPGDTIIVETEKDGVFDIVTTNHPDDEAKSYLGIVNIKTNFVAKPRFAGMLPVLDWFKDMLWWLAILSFIIGLINLYPIFITDGGRMVQATFVGMMKDKEVAMRRAIKVNMFFLIMFGILIIGSFIKWIMKINGWL